MALETQQVSPGEGPQLTCQWLRVHMANVYSRILWHFVTFCDILWHFVTLSYLRPWPGWENLEEIPEPSFRHELPPSGLTSCVGRVSRHIHSTTHRKLPAERDISIHPPSNISKNHQSPAKQSKPDKINSRSILEAPAKNTRSISRSTIGII